ncbi:hypothetical protein [Methylobacterium sp. ID0610]|uniref:hypothetical protein n=1 Tax=Methylobacterium carpenticola TaxID=3344827 RepID=UPI003674C352
MTSLITNGAAIATLQTLRSGTRDTDKTRTRVVGGRTVVARTGTAESAVPAMADADAAGAAAEILDAGSANRKAHEVKLQLAEQSLPIANAGSGESLASLLSA